MKCASILGASHILSSFSEQLYELDNITLFLFIYFFKILLFYTDKENETQKGQVPHSCLHSQVNVQHWWELLIHDTFMEDIYLDYHD